MAAPTDVSRSGDSLTDWSVARHRRLVLPSWLLSALIHGATLAAFIWMSQSSGCRPDYAGDEGEGFREVGVYLTSGETEAEPIDEPREEPTASPAETSATLEQTPLLDSPPIELERPSEISEPILGLGGPPKIVGQSSSTPSLETTPLIGPPPTNRAVLGKSTSLFGIQDAGRKFVYVLDRSGSMIGSDYDALRSAKVELKASLENLDSNQEFQVIFYNTEVVRLVPRSQRMDMFRGIDLHRQDVDRQLGSIVADGGTSHLEALEAALQYNADVIFFLTDAELPGLDSDQLAAIRRRNNGGARIHCIEFGVGPSLAKQGGPRNFLQKLAEQNGGKYEYRDVKSLR